MKDSIPAFSGLKEEIVSKAVIVKIGSIEVSGSYFTFLALSFNFYDFFSATKSKRKKNSKE